MAIALFNAAEMRELDRIAISEIGIPGPVLMEVAGRGCADAVESLLPQDGPGKVAIICGKGNNGGDGLVAARHLSLSGREVDVFLLAEPGSLCGDAALNLGILERLGQAVRPVTDAESLSAVRLDEYDVILDAILGTGLSKEVRGFFARVIEAINASGVPVVAVDMPSGISGDSGRVMGTAVRATQTVTFGHPKPGQVVFPGAKFAGDVSVVDIGIPPGIGPAANTATWLLTDDDMAGHLARREPDAHKGRFGHLVVVAGSAYKPGAAGLCCRAAMRAGCGLVTLAAKGAVLDRVVTGAVEYMGAAASAFDDLVALCTGKQALAIGPGIGTSEETAVFTRRVAAEIELPVVIDADGLNNLVGHLDLIAKCEYPRILTPHPGEMARLLEVTTAEVQNDRLAAARRLANAHGCLVVLKGAGTIVADPGGVAYVVPTGNPGMASGGTGDVLTGIIAGFVAQGLSALDAACLGAYLHGQAGDRVALQRGQHALIAGDIIEMLGEVVLGYESIRDVDEP
ncbi:MAG TPA: NAD(P)H-hydrate dehydratase [Myxococcota bacterium]|nr:NAD(P)H-hydrate dehydratase [Myxococcota bacterium]